MGKCVSDLPCKGYCWLNVAGVPPFAGIIMKRCSGTLEDQKVNNDLFNRVISRQEAMDHYGITTNDLIKQIGELADQNAKLRLKIDVFELDAKQGQQMRWVPVDERLPEEGQVVDLWLRSDERIVEMTTYVNNNGVYFAAQYESLIPVEKVSHWRATVDDRPEGNMP